MLSAPDTARHFARTDGIAAPPTASALDHRRASAARDGTIDIITTTGRRSGRPGRSEIWLHRLLGGWCLSSPPARPGWYANLKANPRFAFHLEHGARRPGRYRGARHRRGAAAPGLHPRRRRPEPAPQPGRDLPTHLEGWMAGSPLVEIVFDGEAERTREKHHGWSMTVGAAVRLPGDPAARSWAPTSSAWSRRRGASFPPRRLVGDLKAEHPALNLS